VNVTLLPVVNITLVNYGHSLTNTGAESICYRYKRLQTPCIPTVATLIVI